MLLGRQHDIERVAHIAAARKPVAVLGEAGIGKTSLLRAAADVIGRRRYEGGGLATLTWVAYLPVTRAMNIELPRGDHAAVAAAVSGRVDGGLLILDDLHWADPDTLLLLPYLAGRIALVSAIRKADPGTARAEEAARSAGFEAIELGPLRDHDAGELVRRRRSDLTAFAARRVVAEARGNPFLLLELTPRGEPSPDLRASLAARLGSLSEAGLRSLVVLSLLGRPAPAGLVGEGLEEAVERGLGVETERGFEVRHALIAEASLARVSRADLIELHVRLARSIEDPGESARHHFAAGEFAEARRKALAAADGTAWIGERARHLGLAARCAGGPEDDLLRLLAADALIQAGQYGEAEELANAVTSADPEVRAEAHLRRSQSRWFLDDPEGAEAEAERGLSLVAESGSRIEVELRLGRADLPFWLWDGPKALPLAREAWAVAKGTPQEPRARLLLGGALVLVSTTEHAATERGRESALAARREGIRHLRAAVSGARRRGDLELECDAAQYLISTYELAGRSKDAYRLARTTAERAEGGHLKVLEASLRYQVSHLDLFQQGNYEDAISGFEALLAGSDLRPDQRPYATAELALALADVGRIGEAQALIHPLLDPGALAFQVLLVYWVLAELELICGDPARALAAAESAISSAPGNFNIFEPAVTRAWAGFHTSASLEPIDLPSPGPVWSVAARPEIEAVGLLAEGADGAARAEALFDRAADLWAGLELRGELRCRWAAGEAALRSGDPGRARTRLLAVEEAAAAHGITWLLAWTRRSLRAAGIRRSQPRSMGGEGGLTSREREVMTLVAAGRSSGQIAEQLGLRPSTVDSVVKSAMRRLGAKTRIEAAMRASSG